MDPADRKTPPAPFPAAKVARVPPSPITPPPAIADPADQSSPIAIPKAVKRWMPMAKAVGPALVALVMAVADGRTGKHEATKKTDVAYKTLAPSTNENAKEIKELKDVQAKMAVTLELHTRLLLASQPGFTPAGIPSPAPPVAAVAASTPAARRKKTKHAAPAADPTLVKQVQDNAAKTLKEVKRVSAPKPAAEPLPANIPAQPPPPISPTEPPRQAQ